MNGDADEKPVSQEPKQERHLPEAARKYMFKPGQSGNPHGRGKSQFQKLAEELTITMQNQDGSTSKVNALKFALHKLIEIIASKDASDELRKFAFDKLLQYGSALPTQRQDIAIQSDHRITDPAALAERLQFLNDFIQRNGGFARFVELESKDIITMPAGNGGTNGDGKQHSGSNGDGND